MTKILEAVGRAAIAVNRTQRRRNIMMVLMAMLTVANIFVQPQANKRFSGKPVFDSHASGFKDGFAGGGFGGGGGGGFILAQNGGSGCSLWDIDTWANCLPSWGNPPPIDGGFGGGGGGGMWCDTPYCDDQNSGWPDPFPFGGGGAGPLIDDPLFGLPGEGGW